MANDSDDPTLTNVSVLTSFSSIGPYRLVQMLGVGGMGEVWRAEQTAPFHRTVALKLIKVGMDTRAVVARFDRIDVGTGIDVSFGAGRAPRQARSRASGPGG